MKIGMLLLFQRYIPSYLQLIIVHSLECQDDVIAWVICSLQMMVIEFVIAVGANS